MNNCRRKKKEKHFPYIYQHHTNIYYDIQNIFHATWTFENWKKNGRNPEVFGSKTIFLWIFEYLDRLTDILDFIIYHYAYTHEYVHMFIHIWKEFLLSIQQKKVLHLKKLVQYPLTVKMFQGN